MEAGDRAHRRPDGMTMDYDPRDEPHNLARDPVLALVVPRPIG